MPAALHGALSKSAITNTGELRLLSEDLIDASDYGVDLPIQIRKFLADTGRWLLANYPCGIAQGDGGLYQLSVEFPSAPDWYRLCRFYRSRL
jgi:hypothetical protein